MPQPFYREIRFLSADGLELYARDYGAKGVPPVLCLCGLTRNCRDFEPLASLIADRCRMVVLDYRGRGRSAYSPDPKSYRPDVELADAMRLLDILEIRQAGVIGTSRGGLIAMLMGATHPDRLTGVVLNDIGPVIERNGLLRIRTYLGRSQDLRNWNDAVSSLRRTHAGFETLTADEWMAFAHRIFRSEDGLPKVDYDLHLAEAFPSREAIEQEAPDLWPMFETLKALPVTVLRGENSDLLSKATVAEMARRHPGMKAIAVKDRGHPPFLDEPESAAAIKEWLQHLPP